MKDLSNDAYAMLLCFFFFFFFLIFSIRAYVVGTHLNCIDKSVASTCQLHRQVDAIQIGPHNICLYKEVNKKYTGCILKTMELLDCAVIGVYAVIRLDTVC